MILGKRFYLSNKRSSCHCTGLSSYSVILLVVSFFQLHSRPNEVRSNDGSVNLGVLLLEFLETYGRFFNFEKVSFIRGGLSFREEFDFISCGSSQ